MRANASTGYSCSGEGTSSEFYALPCNSPTRLGKPVTPALTRGGDAPPPETRAAPLTSAAGVLGGLITSPASQHEFLHPTSSKKKVLEELSNGARRGTCAFPPALFCACSNRPTQRMALAVFP